MPGTFYGHPALVLQDWIVTYVKTLFPDNGIEYWSHNEATLNEIAYGPDTKLVSPEDDKDPIDHVAAYVTPGHCEGTIIRIGFVTRMGHLRSLMWAKSFGPEDECWAVARTIAAALEFVLFYDAVPQIVSMADALNKVTTMKPLTIVRLSNAIHLVDSHATLIDERKVPEGYQDAAGHLDAVAADWRTILTQRQIPFDELTNPA